MQVIVEYIYVELASCPGNGEKMYFMKAVVEIIDVEGASCVSNRGI
jgi:hypothetical protein